MSRLTAHLLRLASRGPARRFRAAALDPERAQLNRLRSIAWSNSATEFGREHDFGGVKTVEDWRARVPVTDYEGMRDYMIRIIDGESFVLTAEDPVMFARTSGTTGMAKYIPVTPACRGRVHGDPMRTWFWHAQKDHPNVFRGKLLTLVSPAEEGRTEAGIPYGATSGHIYKNLPRSIRSTYLLPYELFTLDSYESRYYLAMRLGVGCEHVSFVATANPSSIIQLVETADRHSESILKDVAEGTISVDVDLPLALRNALESKLKPNPERARMLGRLREERGGRLLPSDYWPHLALLGCWKAGTVGAYLERFPAWFTRQGVTTPVRDWGYLSSEARASVPLSDEGAGGVLCVATNFYEFVRADELEMAPDSASSWEFRSAHELEEGVEYYVFLTTTGGLYRYDINDIVEVVGWWEKTPQIVFRRKGRGMTSLTGEKLSVNHVVDAFRRAGTEVDVEIDHFKAEADPRRSLYILQVESRLGIPEDRREALLRAIDRELGRQNVEYLEKRKSRRLRAPVLQIMRPGWYAEGKRKLVQDGRRLFQAKTILLSTREDRAETPTDPVLAEVTFDD